MKGTMMETFLTQRKRGNKLYAGKRIHAKSWKDAKALAKQIGVEVVGVLREEHRFYPV
jgi:hypothetical protein